MRVVIVGFKVSQENGVYYRKCTVCTVTDNIFNTDDEVKERIRQMGVLLNEAWENGSDFVSIRFIKGDE